MSIPSIYLTEIQTTDLIYYDPEFNKECLKFCTDRDIDYLPSLSDQKIIYVRSENTFLEKEIPTGQTVDGGMHIFDSTLLDRFCAYKLLFVTTKNQITGVIHFSDYNRHLVNNYLFNLIAGYERTLRKLLDKNKFKTEDMFNYCKSKKRRLPSVKLDEMKKLPPFERFFLSDLIAFANDHGVISVRNEPNDLRNAVMHAHDFVNLENAEIGDYIYTLESFQKFFNKVDILIKDYKRVNNRIALSELPKP